MSRFWRNSLTSPPSFPRSSSSRASIWSRIDSSKKSRWAEKYARLLSASRPRNHSCTPEPKPSNLVMAAILSGRASERRAGGGRPARAREQRAVAAAAVAPAVVHEPGVALDERQRVEHREQLVHVADRERG